MKVDSLWNVHGDPVVPAGDGHVSPVDEKQAVL